MKSEPRKNTMTAAVLITAAVVVMIVLLTSCGNKGRTFVLRDTDTGDVYLELPVENGEPFSVTFTHSINRTDVTETYEIQDGAIFLTGCVYYDFGAGVATEMEAGWELSHGDHGEMIITGIHQEMPGLIYVVGTVSDHILTVKGEDYSLRELCGRNANVAFEIE